MGGDAQAWFARRIELESMLSGIAADLDPYERALAELRAREPDPARAARVRVLMTGVPMVHGAGRVLEIIEENVGLVVCAESCTGLEPILEDVDEGAADPLRALAGKYDHLPCPVMTTDQGCSDPLRRLARADGCAPYRDRLLPVRLRAHRRARRSAVRDRAGARAPRLSARR